MIDLSVPQNAEPSLKPCITVIGVGGAGGNAVNNMIADNLQGVDFVVANTDAQALSLARTDRRIQLGTNTTQGLGAGARPDIGRAAAEEAQDIVGEQLQGSNMVFITAGMGGGTGTGAAPVIARVARELGILTVGVVTKPFQFEGAHRMRLAESGIEELSQYVDTLIIIPNQNLFRVANEKTTFADAFKMADDVLNAGVRSITDLMIMPGLINLDFADVRTVMSDMGRAMMGTGEAAGERRALDAAEAAIANPLLEDTCMKGAKGVLINITGGPDVTLFEVDEAANRIRDEVEGEAHIIFGSCFDQDMEGRMRVSVVATGISGQADVMPRPQPHLHTAAYAVRSAPAEPATQKPAEESAADAATPAAHAARSQEPGRVDSAHETTPASGDERRNAPQHAPQYAPPQTAASAQTATSVQTTAAARPGAASASLHGAAYDEGHRPATRSTVGQGQTATATRLEEPQQQSFDMDVPRPAAGKPQDAFIPAPPVGRDGPALHEVPPQRPAFAGRTETRPAMADEPRQSEAARTARGDGGKTGIKALFSRLTQHGQPEDVPAQEKVEPHPRAPRAGELTASAADRPAPTHDDGDELEIPAFLRRQAN